LPGRVRRWSSRAAPEIRAAAEDADGVLLTIDRIGTFQDAIRVIEVSVDEPVLVVDLNAADLDDGDYEVTATATSSGSKPKTISTTRLRLRSGDAVSRAHHDDPALARSTGS